ncbi:hypothetical protein HaLaN_29108, partial [Haematococcus lacustris]
MAVYMGAAWPVLRRSVSSGSPGQHQLRHVCMPTTAAGLHWPIVAEAIFLNREELPVYPLYF